MDNSAELGGTKRGREGAHGRWDFLYTLDIILRLLSSAMDIFTIVFTFIILFFLFHLLLSMGFEETMVTVICVEYEEVHSDINAE